MTTQNKTQGETRHEPEPSHDRLPDQGTRERQGAHRRAAPVDARFRKNAGPASVPCTSPGSWSRETRSFSSSRTSTVRSTSTSGTARGECQPGARRHLQTRGRPSSHARGCNPQRVIKWLKHHVREPLDTYFAYEDASVQDIKAAARAAGFTGNTSQAPLLTYMAFKSRVQGFVLKHVGPAMVGEKGHKATDAIGTLHFSHWVPFENNYLGFFTIFDGDFETVHPGLRRQRPRSRSMPSFHISLARRQPQ